MNVKMDITFPDRAETDLEQLNALLSSVRWSQVKSEHYDGYHAKATTTDSNTGAVLSVTHRYGFDRIQLECVQEENEPGYRYQVETEYCTQVISGDEYHDRWSEAHPDYVMRLLSRICFDDGGCAFVVFYHERVK